MDIDLHIHSNVSDGTLDPAAVVAAAAEARLDLIALADHDTVLGVEEAVAAGREKLVEVIPALEISTTLGDVELHILGYFVDPTAPDLVEYGRRALDVRVRRMRGMIERLRGQGIEISFDRVVEVAGGRGALGRPHLARAMVDAGHVESVPQAFDRYIGNDHPAYIPTHLIDAVAAIRLIDTVGGLSVWAHPPHWQIHDLLPDLTKAGLRGLEVYRPRTSPDRLELLLDSAREAGLLCSGGSDWHGPDQGSLGEFRIQASDVSDLLEAGGI